MELIDGIPVWGKPEEVALEQIKRCAGSAQQAALMADNHKGYAVPIGGVLAYTDQVSPSGVGYDIGCGNCAIQLDVPYVEIAPRIATIMDDVQKTISFGVGRNNNEAVDDPLFDDPAWKIQPMKSLKQSAANQLGTVGGGNHYVDIFVDEKGLVWIGDHFGSRGLGYKTADHFLKLGGARDDMDAYPLVISVHSEMGTDYMAGMQLAGRYAYAGREWVCNRVAKIIGGKIIDKVHNHHNFAWEEEHGGQKLIVVRKGATPAFPGQRGFVGGSMGDNSVIIEGVENELGGLSLYSTIHGAGRVMSRTQAAGRRKVTHHNKSGELGWVASVDDRGRRVWYKDTEGVISRDMMMEWVHAKGVELRGGGMDEAPQAYKRLDEVLDAHGGTIKILHVLRPVGVAMAGEWEYDPWKD